MNEKAATAVSLVKSLREKNTKKNRKLGIKGGKKKGISIIYRELTFDRHIQIPLKVKFDMFGQFDLLKAKVILLFISFFILWG